MDALTLNNVNAMPAPTWHRLHMNETTIEVPAGLVGESDIVVEGAEDLDGEAGAFDGAVAALQKELDARRATEPADTRAMLKAAEDDVDPHDLNIPALSTYEKRAVREEAAQDVAAAFECGMGPEVQAYLERMAGKENRRTLVAKAGSAHTATVRVTAKDAAANVAAIDVIAEENAQVALTVAFDSPNPGSGLVGLSLRVFAGKGSRVDVSTFHTLSPTWTVLDDEGYIADENARIAVAHRVLGAGKSYTGLACDLRGDGSDADISTRYVGHGEETIDFNYVVRHRGKKTTCNLDANGVLADSSRKVLRGTIDLVHGCKGSVGSERETVLLADENVDNKTIPIILCDEDDVAGNHGATIGHVRPEQMNYLMTRGISKEAAERLFANATLEEAAINAPDAMIRASVARLADELGVPFELVETKEGEE